MTLHYAIQQYKNVQVRTASPGELLVMLFDGIFRFLDEATRALAANDLAMYGDRIGRAHAILSELSASLKPELAPALADNLQGIYGFCMGRLVQANLLRDASLIADVARILDPVRDAFRAAVREPAATP